MQSQRRRPPDIEELPSGRYRAVVYAGVDPLTKKPRYLKESAAALAAAASPGEALTDPPTAAEAAALRRAAWTDPEWGLLLWLTMITGLRRGELRALRWKHVDFDRVCLVVQRAIRSVLRDDQDRPTDEAIEIVYGVGRRSDVRQLGRRPSSPLDMVDCLAATRSCPPSTTVSTSDCKPQAEGLPC